MSGGGSTIPCASIELPAAATVALTESVVLAPTQGCHHGQPFAFDLEVLFADRLATLRHQNRSNDPRAAYAPASGKFSREL
jgi:hypothetical protein